MIGPKSLKSNYKVVWQEKQHVTSFLIK